MPTARPAATPALHEEGAFDPEFERTLRIGNPGTALRRALTFAPAADLPVAAWMGQWNIWQRETFADRLAPILVAVASHACQGAAREIQALDHGLQTLLTPPQTERSTLAGKRLLGQLSGARGERFLTKLQAWSEAGKLPTHFLTVYATQSALFHLSLRLLLPGYAYWEWTAALETCAPLGRETPCFADVLPGLHQIAQTSLASSSPFHVAAPFSPAVGVP